MATSEGIPSSIDIEFLELNDNPYIVDELAIIRLGSSGCLWENACLLGVCGCNPVLSDEG